MMHSGGEEENHLRIYRNVVLQKKHALRYNAIAYLITNPLNLKVQGHFNILLLVNVIQFHFSYWGV